jgi:hypothetical protein
MARTARASESVRVRSSIVRVLVAALPWLVLLGMSSTAALAMHIGATNYLSGADASQTVTSGVDLNSNLVGTRAITISWHYERSGIEARMSCRVSVNQVSADELIVDEKDVAAVRASLCQHG